MLSNKDLILSEKSFFDVKYEPPSANSKVYQMTEFQSENLTIWHSLELAEGGNDVLLHQKKKFFLR